MSSSYGITSLLQFCSPFADSECSLSCWPAQPCGSSSDNPNMSDTFSALPVQDSSCNHEHASSRNVWLRTLIICALLMAVSIAARLWVLPEWTQPQFQLHGQPIQNTPDAYHWLSGSVERGHETTHPLSLLLRLLTMATNLSPDIVAYFSPHRAVQHCHGGLFSLGPTPGQRNRRGKLRASGRFFSPILRQNPAGAAGYGLRHAGVPLPGRLPCGALVAPFSGYAPVVVWFRRARPRRELRPWSSRRPGRIQHGRNASHRRVPPVPRPLAPANRQFQRTALLHGDIGRAFFTLGKSQKHGVLGSGDHGTGLATWAGRAGGGIPSLRFIPPGGQTPGCGHAQYVAGSRFLDHDRRLVSRARTFPERDRVDVSEQILRDHRACRHERRAVALRHLDRGRRGQIP